MKVWNVDQNSERWHQLRWGLPTASEFHRIIMPSEGTLYRCEDCGTDHPRKRTKCAACGGSLMPVSVVRPSSQQDSYMYKLIAESMTRSSIQQEPNRYMEQGHEREPQAVSEYEWMSGNDTQKVGFCTSDDGLLGASPDRLVGEEGLLECKCPSPQVHIRHLITNDLEDDHRVQVQGQMLVTGRKWVDVISYNPGCPSVIIRVERDENFISGMNDILVDFVTRLHRTRAELIAKWGDFRPRAIPTEFEAFMRPVV